MKVACFSGMLDKHRLRNRSKRKKLIREHSREDQEQLDNSTIPFWEQLVIAPGSNQDGALGSPARLTRQSTTFRSFRSQRCDSNSNMLPPIINNINNDILTLYTDPTTNRDQNGTNPRGRYAEIGLKRFMSTNIFSINKQVFIIFVFFNSSKSNKLTSL